jgi:sulfur carrier protein
VIELCVNGVDREMPDGTTISGLLELLSVPAAGVAVAVNGTVVPRAEHGMTEVPNHATVEVLTAVQGG